MFTRSLPVAAAAALALCQSVNALAAAPAIDSFAVIRPVSIIYADEFSDGIAPPTGGPAAVTDGGALASYTLNAGASFAADAENGGLLRFDTATMGPSCTNFGCNQLTQVTLNTNTAPGSSGGLRQGQDFLVYANWSFVDPDPNVRYRLRLGDTYQGTANSNDVLDIDVRHTAAGIQVRLLDLDLSQGIATSDGGVTFNPGVNATNLLMVFEHSAGDNFVDASIKLYNGLTPVTASISLGRGFLFDGEDVTQAGFGANAPAAAVPEPATTALLLAGLGLVGMAARRRRV